jgi:hypothetical protein
LAEVRQRLAQGVLQALANAKAQGELPADFDIRREADFLLGILHTLPTMTRAGAEPETLENVVSVALSTLMPNR